MDRRRSVIGIFLILGGILAALGNLNEVKDLIVLPIISIVFLFVYFYLGAWNRRGNVGFLIPGVIIGVVGIYAILEQMGYIPNGMESICLVMLGIGFLLIMLIHTMRIQGAYWGEKYWPIFPGGVLLLIGAIGLMVEGENTMAGLITPAFLILIGVYMLIRPMIKGKNRFYHDNNRNISSDNNEKDKI
jgi:hypothetical protein